MAILSDLPNETLLEIFEVTVAVDLRSLICAQRTSTRFRGLIQEILFPSKPRYDRYIRAEPTESKVNDRELTESRHRPKRNAMISLLLLERFGLLFNTRDTFSAVVNPSQVSPLFRLDGDVSLPFRHLLWASDATLCAAYLRRGASWRFLDLSLGSSSPRPITRLELLKCCQVYNFEPGEQRPYTAYSRVEFGEGAHDISGERRPVTMGMLYNLLLCRETTFGAGTNSWELQPGRRIRSSRDLLSVGRYVEDDPEMVDPNDSSSAILCVDGFAVGPDELWDYSFMDLKEAKEAEAKTFGKRAAVSHWVPTALRKPTPVINSVYGGGPGYYHYDYGDPE